MRFAALLCLAVGAAGADRPLRVLVLTSEPERAALLRAGLAETGRFEVRVTEEPAGLPPAALAGYDALLVDSGPLGPDVERWVASGKGMARLRAGCGTPADAAALRVRAARPGLSDFLTVDRLCPPVPGEPGEALMKTEAGRVAAWMRVSGKGRIFETALGENLAVLHEPAFIALVAHGLEWAAAGKVNPASRRPPVPTSVRALVVTGGHTYDASFYTLFEGDPRIAAVVDPHPMPYRRGDLTRRADVLVLYDSIQDATDSERANLRNFVEAGKGVVLLHHALVDYCNWQWWYQDVVGARWIQTEDQPPRWKTRWKHDVEQIAYPVGQHPVTAGVGPLHLWDETYKGMWFSPAVQVLMKTDDPTSDGPLVWIGPHPKARVVSIELGHDRKAHVHPGYRQLVRNAILWAAGRESR